MANEFLARNEEIVDGTYRLGPLIRRSVGSVLYETEFGEAAVPAVIKVREMEPADAENLIARLRQARELAHPNLLKIYAAGSCALNGVLVVYVVMERADESLQRVVAERALTRSEMREMLVPTLDALECLHKKGYAHSRLRASNVHSVKDQLKLSSDSAIRVDDGGSPAEDMRALGELIAESLTDSGIPQPLADIVQHCLDPDAGTRWTVEQVKARLKTPALEAVPSPRVLPEELAEEKVSRSGGIPKWIYAGLAALVLIVVLAAVVRKKEPVVVPAPPPAIATRQDPPVAAPPAPRTEAIPPVYRTRGRKGDGWSVIVGAYGAREPAEKRVSAMMKRWPGFHIALSEPQAEKTRYLVVLGQNLSEDQAEALRKRAVESGLPRDTYIKRVM